MKKYLLVVSFLVAVIIVSPNISLAQTGGGGSVLGAPSVADLQAQIAALLAQIQSLQAQLNQQQGTQPQWCYDFKYNLNAQSSGKEVMQLQTALEKEGFEINPTEKDNGIFGESTADAVVGFQQKYKDEILNPYNLKYGTGFVGTTTRKKLNSLYSCGVIQPTPTPVPLPVPVPTPVPITNQPPSISGISGPTTLAVNQAGTWEVKANDPEWGVLSYQVFWGDEASGASAQLSKPATTYTQTASFTHSYSRAGIYYPTFTVTDNQGFSAKASISVNVGGISITSPILSISPTNITVGKTYQFIGAVSNATPNSDVKLYLQRPNGTMKYENYYVGRTDPNGVLKVSTSQNVPNAYCCTYSAWVEVGGQKSNVVYINVISTTQPSITVLSPNGGEVWQKGSIQTIKWNSNNIAYISVILNRGLSTVKIIADTIPNQEIYQWTIPSDLQEGNDYVIRITQSGLPISLYDDSDAPFSIVETGTNLSDLIIENISIEKTIAGNQPAYKVFVYTKNQGKANANKSYTRIEISPPQSQSIITNNTLSYQCLSNATFPVPANDLISGDLLKPGQSERGYDYFQPTKSGYITMTAIADINNSVNEAAEGNNKMLKTFYVEKLIDYDACSQSSITVLSPNGGEILTGGEAYNISWQSTNLNYASIQIDGYDQNNSYIASYVIIDKIPNTGVYSWSVPIDITTLNPNFKWGGKFKIFVFDRLSKDYPAYVIDASDAPFSIVAATTSIPSITISSNPSADSSGNVTIKKGDTIVITGTPLNVGTTYFTDYTRAFFFDPIFNNSCGNTDWVMTCTANQIGTSNFYIEVYKNSQTYRSNIIKVTVIDSTTPTATTTSIIYRIYTNQITPNKLYLSTYGDFSGGPDAACKNMGYSNGSTGKYNCKITSGSSGYFGDCTPKQLNYRDKGIWQIFNNGSLYPTSPFCKTNSQNWCTGTQYLEWIECKGPLSVGQNSSPQVNQMASILQSATQILVDMFNYLTR